MKIPPWSVLRRLPHAWLALRAARSRLAAGAAQGLELTPVATTSRAVDGRALAAAVFGLGRRMRGCACLAQAIALANLLRQAGHRAAVVLGAAGERAQFHAHAWVECAGQTYDPQIGQLAALTPVQRFGAP